MASPSLPGIRSLANYRMSWLRSDVVAGVVLTTLLVPQGMAYAELAGLPAITGLYTSILCLIGYAVFGPSRILVLGPDSSLGPMIAATILPILGFRRESRARDCAGVDDGADRRCDHDSVSGGARDRSRRARRHDLDGVGASAARTVQEVDGNGEMIGIGAANVAAGFFQGFPVSTSGSRTAVAEQADAKTQLTGVVGAALIVLMLVLVPGLLKNLPNPTLAAVVIAASLSLADIPGTVRLWRQRRVECLLSIAAFLGVALLGVLEGIAVAVALSILNVFGRAWRPYQTTLGRVPGLAGQHDRQLRPEAEELPGLVIFRFDAPLSFANARTFRDQIRTLAAADPRPEWIVIAAEPITDVDTTAADMLADVDEELNAEGTSLVFAELKYPVREKLESYELIGPLHPGHFFPTLDAAVEAFREKTGADWVPPSAASRNAG